MTVTWDNEICLHFQHNKHFSRYNIILRLLTPYLDHSKTQANYYNTMANY